MRLNVWSLGMLSLALPAFGDAPFSSLRFLDEQSLDPKVWRETAAMLKANRAACDEVWFSTGIGVASLDRHRRMSEAMARAAEDLRPAGIVPSVQFQATMGHSDAIALRADCTGKAWGGFTGRDGTEARYCSCPRQPAFREYLVKMAEIYAEWKPGSIWVDDDLRLNNHSPVMAPLCWCETCVTAFAEREGVRRTRAELAAACDADPALYDRYERFGFEALADCARAIARTVRRISPETRLGYQHGPWRNGLQQLIYRAFAEGSGHPVRSRPGGGAYLDQDPRGQVAKAYSLNCQMARILPGGDIESVCPEIETCPRTYACRTPEGLLLESFLSLALGADTLSMFIMDPHFETPAWYGENLMKPLAATMGFFRDYVGFNAGTRPGGLAGDANPELARIGLPLAPGYAHPVDAAVLTEAGVKGRSDAELKALLGKSLLIDGPAAVALENRGFGAALNGLSARPTRSSAREFYRGGQHMTYAKKYEILGAAGPGAEVLGEYIRWDGVHEGVATALSERNGRRVAILGCGGFVTQDLCSSRFTFLQNLADRLSDRRLPVFVEGPCRLIVLPRIAADGSLRSVGFVNASIGMQKPVTIVVRAPAGSKAFLHLPAEGVRVLEFARTDGASRFVLPELGPWKFAWVSFEPRVR